MDDVVIVAPEQGNRPGVVSQRSRCSSKRDCTLRPTKRPRFSMCGRASKPPAQNQSDAPASPYRVETAGEAAHQADDGEAAGGHDHEGGDRSIGQLVARLRPVGLRLQLAKKIFAPSLHQNGRRATFWRNISEPSSSADCTTTARRWQDLQSRGVTTAHPAERPVRAISPRCPAAFQTTASATRPRTTRRSSSG